MQSFSSKKRRTFRVLKEGRARRQEFRDLKARNEAQMNAFKVKMTVVCYI